MEIFLWVVQSSMPTLISYRPLLLGWLYVGTLPERVGRNCSGVRQHVATDGPPLCPCRLLVGRRSRRDVPLLAATTPRFRRLLWKSAEGWAPPSSRSPSGNSGVPLSASCKGSSIMSCRLVRSSSHATRIASPAARKACSARLGFEAQGLRFSI